MAKEEKTLSEQDRQRIADEAFKFASGVFHSNDKNVGFIAGAEYEHKYQREQQAELVELAKELSVAVSFLDTVDTRTAKANAKLNQLLNSLKK